MTTINIAYEVSAEVVTQIEAMLADEVTQNANHNGEVFNIVRDEFTGITGADSDDYDHSLIMSKINDIIIGF